MQNNTKTAKAKKHQTRFTYIKVATATVVLALLTFLVACPASSDGDSTVAITAVSYGETGFTFTMDETITALTPMLTPKDAKATYTINPNIKANTGLTFDTITGRISGTPTRVTNVTKYTITVVPGTGYTGTPSVNINIQVERRTVSAIYNSITATINMQIDSSLPTKTISDWTGTYALTGTPATLPAGLTLNQDTGAINGTPTAAYTATTYTISMIGNGEWDGVDGTATIDITVLNKIIESVTYLPITATATKAIFSPQTPTVEPTGATVTYALASGVTLPEGLSLETDGSISGRPTTEQEETDYKITVTGTGDFDGSTYEATLSITVETAPDISATYNAIEVTVGTPITDQNPTIDPTGATATYAMATGETLPDGLKLTTDGTISGTPTAVTEKNVYNIALTGTGDNFGQTGKAQIIITIKPKAITSVIYDIDVTGSVGTDIDEVTPTLNPTGLTATYASVNLADYGLAIDETSGKITGKPTKAVETTVNINISVIGTGDWLGATTTATLTIGPIGKQNLSTTGFTITPTNTDVDTLQGQEGSATVTIHSAGLSNDMYSLSLVGPNGTANGISVDFDGIVTKDADMKKEDEGAYTVIATGKTNYQGTVRSDPFNIWVNSTPNNIELVSFGGNNNESATAKESTKIKMVIQLKYYDYGIYRGNSLDPTAFDYHVYMGNTYDFTPNTNNRRTLNGEAIESNQLKITYDIGTDIIIGQWYYFKYSIESDDFGEGPYVYLGNKGFKLLKENGLYRTSYNFIPEYQGETLEYGQKNHSEQMNLWGYENIEIKAIEPNTFTDDTGLQIVSGSFGGEKYVPFSGNVKEQLMDTKLYVMQIGNVDPEVGKDIVYGHLLEFSIKKNLSSTGFSLTDTSATVNTTTGETVHMTLNNAELTPGTDYTLYIGAHNQYSEISRVKGIRITNDGAIIIDPNFSDNTSGEYFVEATGVGQYMGDVSAKFNLMVQ